MRYSMHMRFLSQSPQTGQFNSYGLEKVEKYSWNPEKSLNPLKRVNSILTEIRFTMMLHAAFRSQSPQTGQFNSYRQWNRFKNRMHN